MEEGEEELEKAEDHWGRLGLTRRLEGIICVFMARTKEERKEAAQEYNQSNFRRAGGRFRGIQPDDFPDEVIPVRGRRGSGSLRRRALQISTPSPGGSCIVVDTSVLLEGVGFFGMEECRQIVGLIEKGEFRLCTVLGIEDEVLMFARGLLTPESVSLDSEAKYRLEEMLDGAVRLPEAAWRDIRGLVPDDPQDSEFYYALLMARTNDPRTYLITRDRHLLELGDPSIVNPTDFLAGLQGVGVLGLSRD